VAEFGSRFVIDGKYAARPGDSGVVGNNGADNTTRELRRHSGSVHRNCRNRLSHARALRAVEEATLHRLLVACAIRKSA
jgi:hypothetical protein